MSFKPNNEQQLSMDDSFINLTTREQNAFDKSWAKLFGDVIFPAINEEPFSVLFSTKASRPNTPINVIIGALIIKELFDLSDDEIVESLMFDVRFQYALHTTSFKEQPLSDKTLSRIRRRCYEYEREKGIDLYQNCINEISDLIASLMNVSGQVRRMDSMMVEANIRKLSRVELIYTCIAKMAAYLSEHSADKLPEDMEHYLDGNDYNRTFYHQRSSKTDEISGKLLQDADSLLKLCGSEYDEVEAYQLLVRCLSEQTVVEDGKRRLRKKEDGGMRSDFLQNPSDPEATFRKKAGKEHRGYALNVEESVGENGSVVTNYQFEQNTYSDSQFIKDRINSIEKAEETITIVTDGAYSGEENTELAKEKNVNLVPTALTGKPTPDIMADFEFSEDGQTVLTCPMGVVPEESTYHEQQENCTVVFKPECCAQCPHREACRAKINSKSATVTTSIKAHNRAKQQRFYKTEEFSLYSRLRNGVETVPSILRNVFHIDHMPRGYLRAKFFVGSKIGALNFNKLFAFRQGRGHYAQNALLV